MERGWSCDSLIVEILLIYCEKRSEHNERAKYIKICNIK